MSKINYGKKDLTTQEDFEPKNAKERISIWVDEQLVDAFRERARAENSKYQTLMNEALRQFINKPSLIERVERIEKKLAI
jgi:uncharacterized protein (DUF4415 family)